jgi:tRNA-specific 2-thiouridylase
VLGEHQGVVHFTIGQRRGIEIGGQPEPLYVVRIEPEERRLVVGPRRALAVAAAKVESINWLAEDQARVEAKVRSLARPVTGTWDGRPACSPSRAGPAVVFTIAGLLGGGLSALTEVAEQAAGMAAAA